MFWSVVRHGDVGVNKSFETALREIAPAVDWNKIEKRKTTRPIRYSS
jgi:hypothetical protein